MSNLRKYDESAVEEASISYPKGDRQRAEILRAAALLFAEKGYHGTRTHEIAEAVKLSRTAFYFYFKNKEELLTSLVDDVTYTLQRRSSGLVEQEHKPASAILRELVVNYAELVMEMGVEFRFVSRNESDFPSKIAAAHDRAKRTVLENFVKVINRGNKSGSFKVADATVVSLAIIGMCNWSAWWYRNNGRINRSQIAQMFAQLSLQMVGSDEVGISPTPALVDEFSTMKERLAQLEKIVLGVDTQ